MSPPSAEVDSVNPHELPASENNQSTKVIASPFPTPLKYSGTLDEYDHFDVTAVIGREFPKLQLTEIIHDDAKIRDLAIIGESCHIICHFRHPLKSNKQNLVSQRGVVFFRKQDLTTENQKTLAQRLGELSGKPKESGVSSVSYNNAILLLIY